MEEEEVMRSLAAWWCWIAHDALMWPVHGRYACRVCGREFPVAWSNAKIAGTPSVGELRIYEQAAAHGR